MEFEQLKEIKQAKGKEIREINVTDFSSMLCVIFTDSTFLCISSDVLYDGDPELDCSVEISNLSDCDKYELGLITKQEYEFLKVTGRVETVRMINEQEKELYLRLKEKFEVTND